MPNWLMIIEAINSATQTDELYHSAPPVSGGDINSAYQLIMQSNKKYFVKLNQPSLIGMFIAEFSALIELDNCQSIGSPAPLCYGTTDNNSFIVMEYLPLQARGNHFTFGQNLAKMHQISQQKYGWKLNNTIGSTPQSNLFCDNWLEFYKTQRLIPQFELLYQKGYQGQLKKQADYLLAGLEDFFQGHKPIASLLHGDLWSGNYAFDGEGRGVIFDPALYYGDRETDIAMTELFGGFSVDFYRGYQEQFPFADNHKQGYTKRKPMYNLYHILNHANLFGGSYLHQALTMMEQLTKN
ncbi:MAG: fructosamine kinase family protein [Pseudomonadota bacterium]